MRPESNLKIYCLISIAVHLMFFVVLNCAYDVATYQHQTETYEFVPVSEVNSQFLKPSSNRRLKKSAVLKDDKISNSASKKKTTTSSMDTPSESSQENILPPIQADNLLSEGVRIMNINEVTQSVKRTPEAIAQNIEGKIKLKLLIDENGQIRQMTALNSLGYGLDEVASQTAKKLVFIPARIKSRPVAVEIYYTIKFTVNHQ